MSTTLQTIRRRAARAARQAFAPFLVVDDYGTHLQCWTMDEALSWLPSCSSSAQVWFCRLSGWSVVAAREVSAS